MTEVYSDLRLTFVGRAFDLEPFPCDVCAALSVAADIENKYPLSERIELGELAIETFEEIKQDDSTLGSAFSTWPKARKLVNDLELHIAKAKVTVVVTTALSEQSATVALQSAAVSDIVSCQDRCVDTVGLGGVGRVEQAVHRS